MEQTSVVTTLSFGARHVVLHLVGEVTPVMHGSPLEQHIALGDNNDREGLETLCRYGLGLAIVIADAFSDAERAADKFDGEVDELKRLSLKETKKLVTTICEAEEAERKSGVLPSPKSTVPLD